MIAMALACEPDILIADEPTTALDVTIQAQILELMQQLQRELGMAIIMITHDLGVVAQMCDEIVVMYAGSYCERGTADEIFYDPRHEYTKGLLRSIPTTGTVGQKLQPITGTPIDLLNLPKGCPFAPRCDAAMKICIRQAAENMELSSTHKASCWINVQRSARDMGVSAMQKARKAGMDFDDASDIAAALEAGGLGASVLSAEVHAAQAEESLEDARERAAKDVQGTGADNLADGDIIGDAALLHSREKSNSFSSSPNPTVHSKKPKKGGNR